MKNLRIHYYFFNLQKCDKKHKKVCKSVVKFIKKHEKMWYIIFCWKNLKKCLKRLQYIIKYYKIKKNIG